MATVYLALGTNLGDRAANLRQAYAALRHTFTMQAASTVYETEPAYLLDQPRFYNAVCQITTAWPPLDVLRWLKQLETTLGRTPSARFGPRQIDLDILFYDDVILNTPELNIPHPRLAERAFVLVPLAQIAPDLIHPHLGVSIHTLREQLGEAAQTVWATDVRLEE